MLLPNNFYTNHQRFKLLKCNHCLGVQPIVHRGLFMVDSTQQFSSPVQQMLIAESVLKQTLTWCNSNAHILSEVLMSAPTLLDLLSFSTRVSELSDLQRTINLQQVKKSKSCTKKQLLGRLLLVPINQKNRPENLVPFYGDQLEMEFNQVSNYRLQMLKTTIQASMIKVLTV